jgi:flagellar basal-body rod protein FlgF
MDKLIFTAVSGAERLLRSQQVHANNLANLDTSGFRASMETAGDQALAGYGYDDRHMSTMQADSVSTRAGSVRETGRPLDVAIGGQGFLAVQNGDGEAYTRSGEIEISAEGALSVHGHPLLGEGGPITLPQHTAVEIGTDGTISVLTEGATQMQTVDMWRSS